MPVVSSVVMNSIESRPTLVSFQNGSILPDQELQIEGHMYQSKDMKYSTGITTSNMVYTGEVEDDEEFNNFLLVHNRKNDEIKLVQINRSLVYPRISKCDEVDKSVSLHDETSVSVLNKEFGSKRKKRLTEQREKLTINIDAVKDQLEDTVADLKIDETANENGTSDENNSLYRPKINRGASTREEIYNLEELIPARVLDTLETEAVDIIDAGNTTDLGFGEFVAANIQKVLESNMLQEVKIRSISIFLYIHYLMKFITTPMKSIKGKFSVCKRSAEVNNHILDNFSILGPNGRTRPVHMKDKSLCYIIILAALGIDYEVDLANLAKDCKVGIKKALEISRILAFSTSSKDKTVVILKLPLPPPVLFTSKRKRK